MDASFYDSIHSALDDKGCRVPLTVDGGHCGVDRIVWSVWDFVMGPEQLFAWEVREKEQQNSEQGIQGSPHSSEDHSNSSFAPTIDETGLDDDGNRTTVEQGSCSVDFTPGNLKYSKSLNVREMVEDVFEIAIDTRPSADFSDQRTYSKVNTSTVDEKETNAKNSLQESSFETVDANSATPQSADRSAERMKSQSFSECSSDSSNFDGNERYAAVYSLSSEIFKSRTADCSEFKLICVADRQIVVASYVYSAMRKGSKSRFSVSLILKERRLRGFLRIKKFSHAYFDDMIMRLKTASLVEADEDLITRMSTELSEYLQILAQLDSHSFDSCAFKVSDSLLSKADLSKNEFLRRCISTHLQCQGRTVVLGKEARKVNRMLRTLAFFESRNDWSICKFASSDLPSKNRYADIYSPYLRLQGLAPSRKQLVLKECYYSQWPVCLIDVDRETVRHTLPLRKHFERMQRAVKRDLGLVAALPNIEKAFEADFESNVYKDDIVQPFLIQMDFLPYDDVIREGFLNQFNRFLIHKALALVAFAKNSTDRGANRSKLSLDQMRTALDLQLDGNFLIVLATADKYKPGIGQFLLRKQ